MISCAWLLFCATFLDCSFRVGLPQASKDAASVVASVSEEIQESSAPYGAWIAAALRASR
jgi:hypothetical protein